MGLELFRQIERILPGGKLTKASDPSQGQLDIFTTEDNPPRVIDLFEGVFGLSREELNRARERSFTVNGVRLIDPLFLFKTSATT